ncbi:MAG TPA: formate dehydrogenase subunit delta [Sphingomonadaceae bacterium]|nr:formate dehydrogenase subunit delta [Sphingomonadaceae bacterium]
MSQPGLMSNAERLVYTANRIALNLAAQEPGRAAEATATHIKKFWEPRMIARMFGALEKGDVGLNEVAGAAFDILREQADAPAAVAHA